MHTLPPLPASVLPHGVRARYVEGVNGLPRVHLLEAGFDPPGRPRLLLLHGFPELAFSWRRVMPALAEAGFHVLAPDQRGYGRTSPEPVEYAAGFEDCGMLNLARDQVGLLAALGHGHVDAVIGHDFGAPVAAWCALLRPDVFRACITMSAPFAGPPALAEAAQASAAPDFHAALAALDRSRKHYQWYYSTPQANAEMWHPPGGIAAFLRAYFHMKSADWTLPDGSAANCPERLGGLTAAELARLPTYYIMDAAQGMAETVAPHLPTGPAPAWLDDAAMAVYAGEYGRTGFQGGLNWYRGRTSGHFQAQESLFAGVVIRVPALFAGGVADWGVFQFPGALEAMQQRAFAAMRPVQLVDGAGHWVQQEQPEAVVRLVLDFLAGR
jgi:pimeloyl-ACP methyl ester carboxylesterase